MVGGAAVVMTRVWESRPTEFVAVIVTLRVPAAVGVPVMAPVVVSTLRPVGRLVAPKPVGELLASIW